MELGFGGGGGRGRESEREKRVRSLGPARSHTPGYIGVCDQVALRMGPRGLRPTLYFHKHRAAHTLRRPRMTPLPRTPARNLQRPTILRTAEF